MKKVPKETDEETIDFEEYSNSELHATFYQMNLSRPLLKVELYHTKSRSSIIFHLLFFNN